MSEVAVATGQSNGVTSIAFSPDGHTLASASLNEGTIQLWWVKLMSRSTFLGESSKEILRSTRNSIDRVLNTVHTCDSEN